MKITFLGTGTSQGIPVIGCDCEVCVSDDSKDRRLRVSVCIEVHGKNILIDIGPDFRYQMLRSNTQRLDSILITHEHRDHVAGLDDIRPFNFKYSFSLPVYATKRVQDSLKKAYDYIFEHDYPGLPKVELFTVKKDKAFNLGETIVQPVEFLHAKLPVMGYRIGGFAYLTDIKTIKDDQLKYLEDLDVLVISALQQKDHYSHLTLDEALELSERIGAKKTYFTHLSHTMGTHSETEKLLPSDVFIAYDGLVIELEEPERTEPELIPNQE